MIDFHKRLLEEAEKSLLFLLEQTLGLEEKFNFNSYYKSNAECIYFKGRLYYSGYRKKKKFSFNIKRDVNNRLLPKAINISQIYYCTHNLLVSKHIPNQEKLEQAKSLFFDGKSFIIYAARERKFYNEESTPIPEETIFHKTNIEYSLLDNHGEYLNNSIVNQAFAVINKQDSLKECENILKKNEAMGAELAEQLSRTTNQTKEKIFKTIKTLWEEKPTLTLEEIKDELS